MNRIEDNTSTNESSLGIQTRFLFADLMADMLNDGMIETKINEMIAWLEQQGCIVAKYGGRSWANFATEAQINLIADGPQSLLRASFLNGNFDIFVFPSSLAGDMNALFGALVAEISRVIVYLFTLKYDLIKNNNNAKYALLNASGSDNYVFSSVIGDDECNTVSCGKNFHFMLDKSDRYIDPTPEQKIMLDEDQRKSIFYIEFSFTPLGNPALFTQLMISANKYLTPVGLFFISSFLKTDRDKEKGVSIDSMRKIEMDKYIDNRSIIDLYHRLRRVAGSPNEPIDILKQKLIIQLFLTDFNELFGTENPFYQSKQSEILLYFFEKYGAQIEVNPGANTQIYSEWFKTFNDALLNSRGGGYTILSPDGSRQPSNLPSMRQLMNWLIISTERYCDGIRMEKSGGDSLRYYLFDSMPHTSDIDAKLFYYNPRIYKSVKKKLIVALFFLRDYLHTKNFFRFNEQRRLTFGGRNFTLTFDTTSQQYISSIRILPKFFVPLLSIDLRLKFFIQCEEGIQQRITGNFSIAPLDIGFNQKQQEVIKPPMQTITLGSQLFTGVLASPPNTYYITPIPTIQYLLQDIDNMYSDPINAAARRRAGKEASDNARRELLRGLSSTDPNPNAIRFLEQYEEIPIDSELSREVQNCLSMFQRILSLPDEIKLKTLSNINQFATTVRMKPNDIILAKKLMEARVAISTPFGFDGNSRICESVQAGLKAIENINIKASSLRPLIGSRTRKNDHIKKAQQSPTKTLRGGKHQLLQKVEQNISPLLQKAEQNISPLLQKVDQTKKYTRKRKRMYTRKRKHRR